MATDKEIAALKAKKELLQEIKDLEQEQKAARLRKDRIDDMKLELETMQQFGMVRDAQIRQQEIELENLKLKRSSIKEQLAEQLAIENQIKAIKDQLMPGITEENKISDEIANKMKEKLFFLQLELDDYENIDIKLNDINKQIDEQDEKVDKLKKNTKEYDDLLGGIASKIGLGNSKLLKTVQNWTDIGKKITSSDAEMKKFVKSAKQMFSLQNIAASLIESYIGLALEIDKAGAKLAASTGAGTKFRDVMSDIKLEGYAMGRSMENISQTLLAFNNNLIGMNNLSYESIKQIGTLGADLKRLGISGEDFTKTLNIMTKSMGVSNKHAANLTKELAMIGTNIGLSSQRMIKDFTAASATLAVHGSKSIKVFKNLAAAARNSGTEMSELLGIASKFDTFASAAETTAKLNAILGSQMSATKMLMQTEDERIETMIKSVQSQGVAFNQMDRFTQKAIAQAAGISDMSKANQIFGMSLGAYRKSQTEMNKQANVQKKLTDAIQATIPIQEKFANMIQSIVANKGFMKFINKAIDGIGMLASWATKLNVAFGGTLPVLLMLGGGLKILFGLLSPFGMAFKGIAAALSATGDAATKTSAQSVPASQRFGMALRTIGAAAVQAAGGIGVLVLAAIGIGIAIGLAAYGVGFLVKAFGGLGDAAPAAAAGVLMFGLAMVIMITALGSASTIGAAAVPIVLLIVGAMLLAAAAIDLMSRSLTNLFEQLNMLGGALMAGAFDKIGVIAEGIKKASDELQGLGEDNKIQLMTTLNSMATIATGGKYIAETATATAGTGIQGAMNAFNPSVSVNNSFGNLKLVLADGTQLDAYIQGLADANH